MRSVALVYQAFVNYPHWNVYRNLASPLIGAGRSSDEIRQEVLAIASQLELSQLLERAPASLSGGQQQRLAIGRALAKQARVLVLDEPLVNLDYKLRESLTLQLRELLARADLTVVYTSTDPRDAFALGDDVILLADHEVAQSGPPLALYQQPCSPAAMDLMSDPGANRQRCRGSQVMVRPEHLTLDAEPGDRSFPATVLSRETNGTETYLHCDVMGEHWVAKLDGLVDVNAPLEVELHADPACVMEFPLELAIG